MSRRSPGFSLLEIMVVITLTMIGSAVAIVQMRQSVAALDADKASNLVLSQMRLAREVAVNDRRNVLVEFPGTNKIKVTRQDGGGGTTLISQVTLPGSYTYGLPSGVTDTPEGYGNGVAVSFGIATSGTFAGDGTFVSTLGIVTNGTVFTIGSGNGSARALTVTGASGRMKQYQVKGTSWIDR